MPEFWRKWLVIWCWAVVAFGALLALGALDATKAPVEMLYSLFNPAASVPFDATMRFSIGLMGAVSIGWGLTLLTTIRAALALGREGRAVWGGVVTATLIWYVIDSSLSVATGFALNAVSNTVLLLGLLLPLWRTGMLGGRRALAA